MSTTAAREGLNVAVVERQRTGNAAAGEPGQPLPSGRVLDSLVG